MKENSFSFNPTEHLSSFFLKHFLYMQVYGRPTNDSFNFLTQLYFFVHYGLLHDLNKLFERTISSLNAIKIK